MAAYPGRTDLQVPKVKPGQPQGVAGAQAAALRAVPMHTATGPVGQPAPDTGTSVVPMDAPTQNPNEPVTAGAPIGAGPGIEALGPGAQAQLGNPEDPVRAQVAALYRVNPNPDLLRLMELLDMQGR